MLFAEVVGRFLKHMESAERSSNTISSYKKELNYFNRYVSAKLNYPAMFEDIGLHELEDYLLHLKRKGNKSASRGRIIYIFRSFYNYCRKTGISSINVAESLETIKIKQEERLSLTEGEFTLLLNAANHTLVKYVIQTLYYTGLRISEALSLKLEDVDLSNSLIDVIAGKGNKDRKVPVNPKLKALLYEYLTTCRPGTNSRYFFCTKSTGRLSPQSVNRILKIASSKLGWSKRVTAHNLRHSFASNLIKKNAALPSVQKLLGHADLRVTSRYIHTGMDQLKETVNLL